MKKVIFATVTLALASSFILAGCSSHSSTENPTGKTVQVNPSAKATFYDAPAEGYATPNKAVTAWVSGMQNKRYDEVCKHMTADGISQLTTQFKQRGCQANVTAYANQYYKDESIKVGKVEVNPHIIDQQDKVNLSTSPTSDAYVLLNEPNANSALLPSLHHDKVSGWQFNGYSVSESR
jgi:ABC-type enterochelin transport system substrate-binding protein